MTGCRPLSVLLWTMWVSLALVAPAGAQPQQANDLWQYPSLAKSKFFQRWWWGFHQRAYPLGYIPDDAKSRALAQIERSKTVQAEPVAPVTGASWFNIGPAPMLGGQIGATGGTRAMSGRVTTIAVDPGNLNRWLIGGAQGGVWETRDAGATWAAKTDSQASLAMGAIAFAPSNPNIIYAGTGEANFSGDSYSGAGLLKSIDGGNTWTLLATDKFAKNTFSAIRVDPGNPDVVIAASARGLAGRASSFPPSPPATGVFRSTDGGVTWTNTRTGTASDLVVPPTSFSNQYAGFGNSFTDPNNALVRSTDGGQTWAPVSIPGVAAGQIGRISLAIAPSNASTMYVAIQRAFGSGGNEGALLGLFRTDNAWETTPTFISIPQPGPTVPFGFCGWDLAFSDDADQCWYDMIVTVDPTDANTLYAGGVQLWKCTNCAGSPTWTEISKTVSDLAHGIHVDQHSSAWAGGRLIVGNDGGVWSTLDGGSTWLDHNTTLSLTQFFDGSVHTTNPNFALGGAQDNGTMKWVGADAWDWISGGDGAASAISSSNPDTNWAVSSQNLDIRRTLNGGASFSAATSGIDLSDAPFISRFEKCPTNDNVFIAGTHRIWRSVNFFSAATPTWSDNNSGSFTSAISGLAFAASDTTCNTYAFGSALGSLRVTTNGGTNWQDLDVGNAVPNRAITDLAFDPANSNILYVTISGFDEGTPGQPGHVFKTSNALAASPTWTNVSPPVNLPHNTIAIDPGDPTTVYVGTDLGVWKSVNGGASWTHMGPEVGMPNVAVFDLKVNASTDRLVAFTHGRGAFALGVAPELVNLSTRGQVGTGNNQLIGGLIIQGTTPKTVLLRGRGPSLGGAPFFIPGVLPDTFLAVFSGSTLIAQNNNWQDVPNCNPGFPCGTAGQISATGLDPCQPNPAQAAPPPNCALESAILITLPPGAYTVQLSGVGGQTGVGLVEVFEADDNLTPAKLHNIATRGVVGTGNNQLIGGLIIEGSSAKQVLIRGRGPSLGGAPFFIPGALSDSFLAVFSGSTLIAQNNNWQDAPNCNPGFPCGTAAQIVATALDPCQPNPGQVSPPPNCALESAILITLPPGAYTMQLSGAAGQTGVGLVEVFEIPF